MPGAHLSRDEREVIAIKQREGWTLCQTAGFLGRSPSTICRELQRNTSNGIYCSEQADGLARNRRHKARKPLRLNNKTLWRAVKRKLQSDWPPEMIALHLKNQICTQTIYSYLHRKEGSAYRRHLLRKKPYRCGSISNHQRIRQMRMITERPSIVGERSRFGDWECDTLCGAGRRSNIIVCVERRSRYVVLVRLNSFKGMDLNRALTRALKARRLPVHTLTVDQGMEFSMHKALEKSLKTIVYFAEAHSPWQKGSVENMNMQLRRYMPKGTDLSKLTQRWLGKVARRLNTRPRKILNCKTPVEVLRAA